MVLWALVLVFWFGMLMRAMLTARARGQREWANLFLFIACYAAAILINAMFDVVLEGPMQGIWFWCLFGFGVGSVMIYRARPVSESPGRCAMNFEQLIRSGQGLGRSGAYSGMLVGALASSVILGSPATVAAAPAVSDAPCPLGAIAVEPGTSIQAAVDSAGAGAAFCLKNGMHRMQVVRPPTGPELLR